MATYLLDADTLSYVLRKRTSSDRAVLQRLRDSLSQNDTVILSPMAFYEVYRGLLHRNAVRQIEFLTRLSGLLLWDELQQADWLAAATGWADCTRRGRRPGDADAIIAAHARRHGAVVVTNNTDHFHELGSPTENWRPS